MNCLKIAQQKHFVHNQNLLYFQWRHNSYNNDIQHNDTQPNDIQRETKNKGFAKCHLCWMSQIFPLYWVGGGATFNSLHRFCNKQKLFFIRRTGQAGDVGGHVSDGHAAAKPSSRRISKGPML